MNNEWRKKKMKKITRYTVSIGLNDKDSKKQEVTTEEAKNIINNSLKASGCDATLTEVNGVYTHQNGERVTERSYNAEILFCSKKQVFSFADMVKKALNQETVIIKKDKIKSVLY